jgi:cytidylate kinase
LNAHSPVITFDGPSGSGKGTLSLRLAAYLHWHLLDSGAIYRIAALEVMNNEIDLSDTLCLKKLLLKLKINFKVHSNNTTQYFLHGKDVTETIRSTSCSKVASRIASIPAVREALLAIQQGFLRPPGLVADGRDMGTVVFPDAVLKFYIIANDDQRAMRRYNQLKSQGINVSLSRVRAELKARDERDTTRKISPLRLPEGAIVVDTTAQTIDASFEKIMTYVSKVINKGPLEE